MSLLLGFVLGAYVVALTHQVLVIVAHRKEIDWRLAWWRIERAYDECWFGFRIKPGTDKHYFDVYATLWPPLYLHVRIGSAMARCMVCGFRPIHAADGVTYAERGVHTHRYCCKKCLAESENPESYRDPTPPNGW